jgi:anaerobic ribonucleoside-triphosphate reductase
MDEHKGKWLKTWGLRCDKSVIDCEPTAQLVQLDDGSVHQLCEQYQRVMGYFRPVNAWNPGKQQEHRDRTFFVERKAQDHA